jgi:hypothetical protein
VQPLATLEGDNKGQKKHNASEDPPSYTKVDGYPPSSWNAEASSKKKNKKKNAGKKKGLQRSDRIPAK